jgi:Protein of unknown function (DUF2628)
MAIYTVHEPPLKAHEAAPDPERFVFVRDGFTFWAFLLGPVWMLWHRLWLVLLGYVVVMVALQVVLQWIGAPGPVVFAVNLLVALLVGFEAATLRRFALARRRWRTLGAVAGERLEAAERRFFDVWFKGPHDDEALARMRGSTMSASAVPILRRPQAAPEVIGLFPQPGVRR